MIRAEKRGANVNRLFVRRFLALLGIGLVHAFLFWSGDILVTYALTGFFLLLFRHCSLKVAVIVAAILFGTTALAGLAGVAVMELLRLVPEARQKLGQIEQQAVGCCGPGRRKRFAPMDRKPGSGDWRTGAPKPAHAVQRAGYGADDLAMFLLGLQVGRYDVLRHVEHYRPLLRKIILWGLIVGVPANLFYAWAMENLGMVSAFCAMVVNMGVGGPAFAFVYAAGLTLLLQRARWQRVFAPVAAAGRMALTNYLLHSLIGTTLAYGYGFGLFGRVAPRAGASAGAGHLRASASVQRLVAPAFPLRPGGMGVALADLRQAAADAPGKGGGRWAIAGSAGSFDL